MQEQLPRTHGCDRSLAIPGFWIPAIPAGTTYWIKAIEVSPDHYLAGIESLKIEDAYHSLSIERHRVTPELIQKIADGQWNTNSPEDKQPSV